METEKTTSRQAVDYGDQVAGLHSVRGDLVGAVAEALAEHSAADFYFPAGPSCDSGRARPASRKGLAPQGARDDRPGASLSGSPGFE